MRVVSLFSGCGGLDLGLQLAGHEIILQNDPDAQAVLRDRFPTVPLVPDVRHLLELPRETEIVAAGFPCIDVSRNGNRQGVSGPDTGLVQHVLRLVRRAAEDHRPVPWLLFENVLGLTDMPTHDGGMVEPPAVQRLVSEIEAIGYGTWAHRVLSTQSFGIPHRRKRIFLLAAWHADARDVLLCQGTRECDGLCKRYGGPCWRCYAGLSLDALQRSLDEQITERATLAREARFAKRHRAATQGTEAAPVVDAPRVADKVAREEGPECASENPATQEAPSNPELTAAPLERAAAVDVDPPGTPATPPPQPPRRKTSAKPSAKRKMPALHDAAKHAVPPETPPTLPATPSTPVQPPSAAQPQPQPSFAAAPATDPRMPALAFDLGEARSEPVRDMIPSLTTSNRSIVVALPTGKFGFLRLTDAERLQGLPEGWTRPALGSRATDTEAEDNRGRLWVMIGNAVTVDVASWIGERLMQPHIHKYASFGPDDMLLHPRFQETVRLAASLPVDPRGAQAAPLWRADELDARKLGGEGMLRSWPDAAWYVKGVGRYSTHASDAPLPVPFTPLSEFITETGLMPDQGRVHLYLARLAASTLHAQRMRHIVEAFLRAGANIHEAVTAQVSGMAPLVPEAAGKRRGTDLAAAPWMSGSTAQACKRCESCVAKNNRRCFMVRVGLAARAGHHGAQLAAYGEDCIGAVIEVYWPLDERCYRGRIVWFNPFTVQHVVLYEDGDVENLHLWTANQTIVLCSRPDEWAGERQRLARRGVLRSQGGAPERTMEPELALEASSVDMSIVHSLADAAWYIRAHPPVPHSDRRCQRRGLLSC